jgi:NAD(P)-dependent dehydrogenase (short-subunit alcohol dehydrogenase family)
MGEDRIRFDGEVVIVAGGGGSLGGAYARLFAARGAAVVVNDIGDAAQAVADEIVAAGGTAIAIVASAADDAAAIVGRTLDRFGRLDVLVNTAGLTNGGLFHLIPADEWNRVFDSHFTATLALSAAAWPHLSASGNGRLINTASTSIFGSEYSSTYIAAKAAIFGASQSWAMEGRTQNVRVNVVLPTAISQMTANIPDAAIVRLLTDHFQPEKVAGLVAWLAHRDTTLDGVALEVGGGRAAAVFLAQAESVKVADPASPEAWIGHEAALGSRIAKHAPASMMAELRARLEDLAGTMNEPAATVAAGGVWAVPA